MSAQKLVDPEVHDLLLELDKSRLEIEERKNLLACLVNRLEALRNRLLEPKHASFSNADDIALFLLNIHISPLFLIHDKTQEIRDLGSAELSGCISMDIMRSLISLARNDISTVTETGCCSLINVVLLRVISVLQSNNSESTVNMVPDFPLPETVFERASGKYTFSGAVDFLLAKVPDRYTVHMLENPTVAVAQANSEFPNGLMSLVFKAKKGKVRTAVCQAAIAAASYCQEQNLPAVRGVVTSGEEWLFFTYETRATGTAVVRISLEFTLGESLEGLPIILGLLRDWVQSIFRSSHSHSDRLT